MKKNGFLIGFLVFVIFSIVSAVGSVAASGLESDLDNLQYVEGEYDYYHTRRKWKNRRRGDEPFRKYLFIYLEDDLARYEDSKYFLGNLEQNALLMIFDQWPRENIEIGYVETDDAGLRKMYDIVYEGESLVDLEGIRKDIQREALILLIFSIVAAAIAILCLVKHFRKQKSI